MGLLQGTLACLGRVMIATIFLVSAAGNKIWKFNEVAGYMAAEGVPQMPVLGIPLHKILLTGAIAFLLLGGLSVAAGYRARIGGFMLLVFLGAATYYFHDFWNVEPEKQPLELIQFLKNLSLAGTMLFIIANGAGPGSLDRRRQRQKKRPGREALASQNATSESRSFDDQPEPVEVGDVIDEEGR
jgi:putative oxidoreductase